MTLREVFAQVRSRINNTARLGKGIPDRSFGKIVPFKGYTTERQYIKFVDQLDDKDLSELNAVLAWKCFVVDQSGRRFGNAAWPGKRCEPQPVPDRRIILLNERFDLPNKHVLEVGCFEGIHTVGLSQLAHRLTAIDARIENVVKTIVRCAFYGFHPTVFKCDIEARPLDIGSLAADVLHHVGVLYHLRDPVRHLLDLKSFIRHGILLDTHYAMEQEATERYTVNGKNYPYKKYSEGYDPFSGIYDHSKWLLLADIVALLKASGFDDVEIVETRNERNGPRALILAGRKGSKF